MDSSQVVFHDSDSDEKTEQSYSMLNDTLKDQIVTIDTLKPPQISDTFLTIDNQRSEQSVMVEQ